jgi:hypothetical protein
MTVRCAVTWVLLLAAAATSLAGEKTVPASKARHKGGSRTSGTMMKLAALHAALEEFKQKCGAYPTTAQGGLRALFILPANAKCGDFQPLDPKDTQWLVDGWGNEFLYDSKDGKTFTLRSHGSDRKTGGRGANEDIISDSNAQKHLNGAE